MEVPKNRSCWPVLGFIQENQRYEIFTIVYSHTVQEREPKVRLQCFQAGAKMVTCYPSALKEIFQELKKVYTTKLQGI